VIVAEDITSRFLSVISLFNGSIPLVAIQLSALQFGTSVSLVFSKVLDEMRLGLVDEDEEVQVLTTRTDWEDRASKNALSMADEMLDIVRTLDPGLELKYNKFYIGLAKGGQPNNFVIFVQRRTGCVSRCVLNAQKKLRQSLILLVSTSWTMTLGGVGTAFV